MHVNQPTIEEWHALYDATDEYCRVAPWVWMSDVDIFGVQDPVNGDIGYCCVMGAAGKVFGLNVYQGGEGLAGYWEMAHASESEWTDVGNRQKFIAVNMEDRSTLRARDLANVKAVGRKYRGSRAWPMFLSLTAGYEVWYLDRDEARLLTLALRQTLDVAERFQNNPDLLPHFEGIADERYLVRVASKTADGYSWRDEIMPGMDFHREYGIRVNTAAIDKIGKAAKRTGMALEVDYTMMECIIAEQAGERGYFPNSVLIVEAASGFVFAAQVVNPSETHQVLADQLLGLIEREKIIPAAIHVRRDEVFGILTPVCDQLKITLKQLKRLPELEKARKSMARYLSRGR